MPATAEKPLNALQNAFAFQYLVDGNATLAAKRAGYKGTDKSLAVTGCRLLTHAKVAALIEDIKSRRAEAVDLDKEWVLRALKRNFDKAMTDVPVLDKEGNRIGVYVYQGQVANRAAELIGKELGMFVEKVAHQNPDGTALKLVAPVVDVISVIAILRAANVVGRVENIEPLKIIDVTPKNGANGNGH